MEKTPAEENSGAPEATPGSGTPDVPETLNQIAGAGGAKSQGDAVVSKSSTPPVAPGTATGAATGAATGVTKLKAAALAITAAALGAAGAIFGPSLFKQSAPDSDSSASGGGNVAVVKDSGPKVGFTFGKLPVTEPIEKIVVTLTAGANGKLINERVDLHLGMGFPLRLFPLGNESREPAFAALPQKSSLPRGVTSIKPGESAAFEFLVTGEDGQDVLNTTPQLLKDLKVGDIKGVGFSSIGENGWILGGYRIEVNGKLFAANDSVNVRSDMVLAQIRRDLASGKPESEVLLKEIANLKKTMATGLSSPADKAKLAEKEAALAEIAEPLNRLAGQGAGYYPWYVERNEQFLSALAVASPVGAVGVKLTAGGGGDPGTRNPVYLKAGSKKFLLTSETDPLAARTGPQEFTISMADLEQNPMTLADLDKPGLGIIGNEERYGQVPDRAKIQRIQVTVDGKPIYDSESKAEDRRALAAYWLVPPVHYDYTGQLVRNEEKPTEKHLWASGMVAPRDLPVKQIPLAPEMPPRLGSPGIGSPGIGSPGIGSPGISGPGISGPGTGVNPIPANPGGGNFGGGNQGGGNFGGGNQGGGNFGGGNQGGNFGGGNQGGNFGGGNQGGNFGGGNQGGGNFGGGNQGGGNFGGGNFGGGNFGGGNQGGGNFGGGGNSGLVTSFSGLPSGTFIPNGQVDPISGLLGGFLQRSNNSGFNPNRGVNSLSGLNPVVFIQPTNPTNPSGPLTPADIAKIIDAIGKIIKPTPAPPTPALPIPPPTIGSVEIPNTTNFVQIGTKTTVDWTILGNTAGMGGISSFRIELLPVLPHLSPPVPAGSKPLATTTADANSLTVSVPAILLPPGGTFPGVAKTDLPLLNVQPRVTALDDKGKTIGTAKDGPILPLIPSNASQQGNNIFIRLSRGITNRPLTFISNRPSTIGVPPALPRRDPLSALGGSFQIFKMTTGKGASWKALGLVKPGLGESNIASMIGLTEEGSMAGPRFAPTEIAPASPSFLFSPAFNTAVRTNKKTENVVLMFEGGISYPTKGGVPLKAGVSGALKGYRVVGHLGFLAGSSGGAGKAEVLMRVDLSGDGTSFAPTIIHDLDLNQITDPTKPLGQESAYFRLETDKVIEVAQKSGGPMQEFDIPISFEALDKGLGGAYPASRPTASFGISPSGSDFANPANQFSAPMKAEDYAAYERAKNGGAMFGVTISLMIDTSGAAPNDTLGIFGLRLVPDVY